MNDRMTEWLNDIFFHQGTGVQRKGVLTDIDHLGESERHTNHDAGVCGPAWAAFSFPFSDEYTPSRFHSIKLIPTLSYHENVI